MKINDIPFGSALLVKVTAMSRVNKGDEILLGVRCVVGSDGTVIPYNEKLQLCRHELNESIGNGSVLIKQEKNGL